MDHQKVRFYLPDFIEQTLADEEYIEIERHINDCNDCNEYYFRLRTLLAKLDQLPNKIEPSVDQWPRFYQYLVDKKSSPETEEKEILRKNVNEKSSRSKFSFKDIFKKK